MKRILSSLFFLMISIFLFAQKKIYNPDKKYTPAQLQEDFSFLRKCLDEAHPGVYLYNSKEKMNLIFDNFAKKLDKEMTEREFRNALFTVVAEIRCGHSSLSNSKARAKYLEKKKVHFIPLEIYSIDNQLFIKRNLSKDSSIKIGSEIVSIQDVNADSLVNSMAHSFISDGWNETHRYRIASKNFQAWYVRLFPEKDTFSVVIRDSLKKEKLYRLPSIYVENFPFEVEKKEKTKPIFKNKMNDFKLDKENPVLGIITLRAFNPFGFWKFYRKTFKYLEKNKIEHLVIDMRGNGGGMIFHPGHLLSYLIEQPEQINIYKKNEMPSFKNHLEGKGKFLKITHKLFPKIPKRFGINTIQNDSIDAIKITTKVRKKYHYDKKLYLLIDGGSFSATCVTSSLLKKNNRGTFIGEETGGGEKECNAMVTSNLELPNSKLQFRFPFYRVEQMNVKPAKIGRGIFPDIEIKATRESVLLCKDLEMEKVRELIKN